jgi:uncharacterized membrane protein
MMSTCIFTCAIYWTIYYLSGFDHQEEQAKQQQAAKQ